MTPAYSQHGIRPGGAMVAYPLFQAGDGGSIPTSGLTVRNLRVVPIPLWQAVELNAKWHSRLPRFGTGCAPRHDYMCFGASGPRGGFLAVAIWSNPAARRLPQWAWKELRRLAVSPERPANTCSWMLARMAAMLHQACPEVERLISYHDMGVHAGTIYRAAGWVPTVVNPGGKEWSTPSRNRPANQTTAPKQRWEKVLYRERACAYRSRTLAACPEGARRRKQQDEGDEMTHIEIIRKLIGPVRPTGQYERDQDHLKNLKVMSGVLLDLLEDVFEVSKYEGRREASIGAIGKYAADTIGIVNENTGAWDAAEALRKTLQSIRDNCRCVCGDGDGMSFCPHCEAKSALATSKDSK